MPMTNARTHGLNLSDGAAGSVLAAIGAVWLLVWACMAVAGGVVDLVSESGSGSTLTLVKVALVAGACLAGSFACFRKFGQISQQSVRPANASEAEGLSVLVDATVLDRRETCLQNPRFVGGSEAVSHVAVAVGAYQILAGQWSMTIEYELDGQRYVDHGKVSSQVYYRYAKADTMPIRVDRYTPTNWTPVLDRYTVPAAQIAASPVTTRA